MDKRLVWDPSGNLRELTAEENAAVDSGIETVKKLKANGKGWDIIGRAVGWDSKIIYFYFKELVNDSKYFLYRRALGSFFFRSKSNPGGSMGGFTITYCPDGACVMSGDMGTLVWQRKWGTVGIGPDGGYSPEIQPPDFGFPGKDTGIQYFAEKVCRCSEIQKIREWTAEQAYLDMKEVLEELSKEETEEYGPEYIEEGEEYAEYAPEDIAEVLEEIKRIDPDKGEVGQFKMRELVEEKWPDFCWDDDDSGWGFTEYFRRRYEMLVSVSEIILERVAYDAAYREYAQKGFCAVGAKASSKYVSRGLRK